MLNNRIEALCGEINDEFSRNCNDAVYALCERFYDATMLNVTDSHQSVVEFTRHVMTHYPNVATICVSPRFIEDVGVTLGDSSIGITSVVGGFPMGQTYIEVKMLECSMAIENGADEVDFVIDVAAVNQGDYEKCRSEIEAMVFEIDSMAVSKVILECGEINDYEKIYNASKIALEAGANFIKTSTGKASTGAQLDHFVVMCIAVKEFYQNHGQCRGIKVAGGVRTKEQAALYYTAVEHILGKEWLTVDLFRIGTSVLVK